MGACATEYRRPCRPRLGPKVPGTGQGTLRTPPNRPMRQCMRRAELLQCSLTHDFHCVDSVSRRDLAGARAAVLEPRHAWPRWMAAGWTQPPCRSSVMDIYLPPAASPLDAPGYAQQGLHQLAAASLRACPECWPRGRTRPHAAAVSTTVRGPRDRLVVFWHDRWVRQHDAFADQGSGRAGSRSRWPAQLSVAPRRGTQPPNMCPGNKLK